MGSDKGLLLLKGKPMIDYLLTIFAELQIKVIIIANNSEYKRFNVPVFKDVIEGKGPLAGIYTGLLQVNTEKNIIVSCDVPCVSKEMIETLIGNSGDEKITVVAYKDKIHPLIGIYSKSVAEKIVEKIESDQLKVQLLIEEVDSKIIQLENYQLVGIENQLMNVNTKEDLKWIEDGK
jgi:molybdopterin-guanine dinucleotide biosynthesis protein A